MYYAQQPAQQPAPAPSPVLPNPALGYSQAHLQYTNERNRWSTAAYKGAPVKQGGGQIPLVAQERREVRIVMVICYYRLPGNKGLTKMVSFIVLS